MVKYKKYIFIVLILLFLSFSFYPTIYDLSKANKLKDPAREHILEHNYYWPDYNLYLSKIRQGFDGRLTAIERYTSEAHTGSLIQEFYVVLGLFGKLFNINPNFAYLLGRIILAPLLLLIIVLLVKNYFKSFFWQITAFLMVVTSGSFPRIFINTQGVKQVGRFMEWWSNIDALQRITFIPHILFGQIASFFLLYKLSQRSNNQAKKSLFLYITLGNLVGLVFPPSLITLNSVLLMMTVVELYKYKWSDQSVICRLFTQRLPNVLFVICSSFSILYIFFTTRISPWSSLVVFHRTHPMMIPFVEYIKGTGPIFFLGMFGAVVSVLKKENKYQSLIFWVLTTFGFAIMFTYIKEQSPLRFTQTGLFIPLGILGAYFLKSLFDLSSLNCLINYKRILKVAIIAVATLYILENLYMMKTSFTWQTTWIDQRVRANIPPVPYPPQAMYPLKNWMNAIRWLSANTNHDDVVLARVTAGNYIPAYSGNTVYFGQANTVDYERKQQEVLSFFKKEMSGQQAEMFLKNGRVKYIFYSVQEKELSNSQKLEDIYPFLSPVYSNSIATIYKY